MNDLQKYFDDNASNLIDKHVHYFDVYDRHFSKYRNTDVHFVEIGIFNGGSLQMWRDYFGPKASIYGIDINPECKRFAGAQIQIFTGDQSDRSFLQTLTSEIPRMDVVLDDGGHTMEQQINTFEELYPHVSDRGVYACEDLHTSYWRLYGGGYRRRGTFIEYSKYFIDYLHAWHSKRVNKMNISNFLRSTYALHYYDSILVIEKSPMQQPVSRQTGKQTLSASQPLPFLQKAARYLRLIVSMHGRAYWHQLRSRPYHRGAEKTKTTDGKH